MRRSLPRRLLVLVAALAVLAGPLLSVQGATAASSDGQVTWSVKPVPASDGTPRATVVQELDPGATASDAFTVTNLSDSAVTFGLRAADGYRNSDGRFDMFPSDTPSVDAGTWISLPDEVTLEPAESREIPFTITVPSAAEPGDHSAGIAAVLATSGQDGGGNAVNVESRVGFRVAIRVTGEAKATAEVVVTDATYALNWNPFRPGGVTVAFTVRNTGNLRFQMAAQASVQNSANAYEPPSGQNRLELLPGDERSFSIPVDEVWPLFVVPGRVTVTPDVTMLDGTPMTVEPIETDFSVVAIPVPQLLVLGGVILIVGALLAGRRRSRRKTRALIEEAREQGRLDAEGAARAAALGAAGSTAGSGDDLPVDEGTHGDGRGDRDVQPPVV